MSQSIEYQPLTEEKSRSSQEACHACHCPPNRFTGREKKIATIFSTLLILSNLSTWMFSNRLFNGPFLLKSDSTTLYANLDRNTPVAFEAHTRYTDGNETLVNELWDQINIDAGMVALPEDFALNNGLLIAQRFPWDRSRVVYLLNGYHSLHCIRAIYISLMEFWQDVPQTRSWGHVIHCVDTLRQDIICNADDTPRYTTSTQIPETGVGQVRLCRSWDKLEQWARQYNACYKYVNQTAIDFPNIQRYIYCPEGSPYKKQVEKVFGEVPSYEDS